MWREGFFCQICDCDVAQVVIIQKIDLKKFGYKSNMKVETFTDRVLYFSQICDCDVGQVVII